MVGLLGVAVLSVLVVMSLMSPGTPSSGRFSSATPAPSSPVAGTGGPVSSGPGTVTITVTVGVDGGATIVTERAVPARASTVTLTRTVVPPPTYDFSIPIGDPSIETIEGNVYGALVEGRCAGAQSRIRFGESGRADWRQFPDPRYLMIYQAAVDACAGEWARAGRILDHVATSTHLYPVGWDGLGWDELAFTLGWHVCEVYKAVVSAVRQRAKDAVPCRRARTAPLPQWPADGSDPRLAVG
jgi:hypothetical protein